MDRRATFAPRHANHSRPPVCVPCVLLLLALQAFLFSSAPGLCHWRSQDGAAHSKRCKRSTQLAMEKYMLGCLIPHGWAPQMQERAMLSPISIPGGRKSPAPVSTHLLHLQSVSSTRPLTTAPPNIRPQLARYQRSSTVGVVIAGRRLGGTSYKPLCPPSSHWILTKPSTHLVHSLNHTPHSRHAH